jgi:lipopolysaccharide/colanic/teichoic acid biosynthesis glycosyltransferase
MTKFWDRFNPFSRSKKQRLEGIYSTDKFRTILERERARADRTGKEFSFVVFDLENADKDYSTTRHLTSVLSRRLRLTDEVGWFDNELIGVCLAYTSAEGASKFAEDVSQRMNSVAPLSYKIYSYPLDWLRGAKGDFGEPPPPIPASGEIPSSRLQPIKDSFHRSMALRWTDLLFVRRIPAWKRGIDIVGSLLGIMLSAPVMLLIAFGIKLTSPGPIIFRQRRIGYRGENFMMYKFRSMTVKANDNLHADYISKLISNTAARNSDGLLKIKDDSRITLIGKFIRKWSLDELPQLFNVLKGDMSLVGPRPDPYYAIPHYARWYYRRIMETKPGITGLWQVEGRSRVPFEEMVRMDIRYCLSLSFICDCKLILRTFKAVLSRIGAY